MPGPEGHQLVPCDDPHRHLVPVPKTGIERAGVMASIRAAADQGRRVRPLSPQAEFKLRHYPAWSYGIGIFSGAESRGQRATRTQVHRHSQPLRRQGPMALSTIAASKMATEMGPCLRRGDAPLGGIHRHHPDMETPAPRCETGVPKLEGESVAQCPPPSPVSSLTRFATIFLASPNSIWVLSL